MAYYVVYDKLTGEIENIVECPEFLVDTIHLDADQSFIKVEEQVSPQKYIVSDGILTQKDLGENYE